MTLLFSQRDLVATFKKEIFLNANLLRIIYPMCPELSRQLFKDDALEKPNQAFFNNFSYYLVCIINPKSASVITWPLFDSKAERAYRTEFANFLSTYYTNGSISPVMSSYFVNPGCYKITKLMFQLSMLAVQITLQNHIKKEESKKIVSYVTEKYKTDDVKSFQYTIDKVTQTLNVKISKHVDNRNKMEQVAGILKDRILRNTDVQKRAQMSLNRLIDNFLAKNNFSKEMTAEITLLKDIQASASILDHWLNLLDEDIANIEKKWNDNTSSLLDVSRRCQKSSEELVLRHTGQIDKSLYSVEFDAINDNIFVEKLALQVPSQQKYILKNIVKSDQLCFPNLIRGFIVAVCYILRNLKIEQEIFYFNELLKTGQEKYKVLCSMLKDNVGQMTAALIKFECTPDKFIQCLEGQNLLFTIPSPPVLTFSEEVHKPQIVFNTYTPLNSSRRQFNLKKKNSLPILNRSSFKSLATPFLQIPKDDFMRNIMCHVDTHNRFNLDHTMSSNSQNTKINETVIGSASGFTKDQINRLLSTKKSSTKKRIVREKQGHMKRGSLFNNTNASIIFRSHSSPNLYENRDRMLLAKNSSKQLSIMAENDNGILELSGIVALENSKDTPLKENLSGTPSFATDIKNISIVQIKENSQQKSLSQLERSSSDSPIENNVTPKLSNHPIRKSSSIEKIINRFKKVRANVCESKLEFKIIKEEKEIVRIVNAENKNKLLPDLLEQSCSTNVVSKFPDWTLFDLPDEKKKTRESLGTALGINKSFLDQFELID